nr:MAG TPA: hypothetical protein [Caudoviricetes sp.]
MRRKALNFLGLSVHCRGLCRSGLCGGWGFGSSCPCLCVGGGCGRGAGGGVFFVCGGAASGCCGGLGCRFLFDFIQPHILRHRQPHTSR